MKIGIIGSGSMGANMGRIWANAGYSVLFSYSRSQEKLEMGTKLSLKLIKED